MIGLRTIVAGRMGLDRIPPLTFGISSFVGVSVALEYSQWLSYVRMFICELSMENSRCCKGCMQLSHS